MSRLLKSIVFVLMLVVSFYAGQQWQKFYYLDMCLDMGGGRHPGGYPVCVVEIEKQGKNE